MDAPLVSIVIPHYRTPDLARLCLRALRRFTVGVPYEVIVVDNDSAEPESLSYLRQVEWIRLIERTSGVGSKGQGHKEAVDIGIAASRAPFVLAFHTDTIAVREDWLTWHLSHFQANDRVAAVGTYKLEIKSPLELWLQRTFDRVARRGGSDRGDHRPYIRSHCALYRKDVLADLRLAYDDPEGDVAGRSVHYALEAHGYEARLLDVSDVLSRVVHLNHGTMVMQPHLGARGTTIRKGLRRIRRFLDRPDIQAIYADDSLDRGERPVRTAA